MCVYHLKYLITIQKVNSSTSNNKQTAHQRVCLWTILKLTNCMLMEEEIRTLRTINQTKTSTLVNCQVTFHLWWPISYQEIQSLEFLNFEETKDCALLQQQVGGFQKLTIQCVIYLNDQSYKNICFLPSVSWRLLINTKNSTIYNDRETNQTIYKHLRQAKKKHLMELPQYVNIFSEESIQYSICFY